MLALYQYGFFSLLINITCYGLINQYQLGQTKPYTTVLNLKFNKALLNNSKRPLKNNSELQSESNCCSTSFKAQDSENLNTEPLIVLIPKELQYHFSDIKLDQFQTVKKKTPKYTIFTSILNIFSETFSRHITDNSHNKQLQEQIALAKTCTDVSQVLIDTEKINSSINKALEFINFFHPENHITSINELKELLKSHHVTKILNSRRLISHNVTVKKVKNHNIRSLSEKLDTLNITESIDSSIFDNLFVPEHICSDEESCMRLSKKLNKCTEMIQDLDDLYMNIEPIVWGIARVASLFCGCINIGKKSKCFLKDSFICKIPQNLVGISEFAARKVWKVRVVMTKMCSVSGPSPLLSYLL